MGDPAEDWWARSSDDPWPDDLFGATEKTIPQSGPMPETGVGDRKELCAPDGFSHYLPVTCEHSTEVGDKDRFVEPCLSGAEAVRDAVATTSPPPEPEKVGLDSWPEAGFLRASKPARSSKRVPPRIVDRPRIEEWTDDELLTLPEAAALFWPDGPITTNTLRTAGRDGGLAITKVAGKHFTTPLAIRRMGLDEADAVKPGAAEAVETSPEAMFQMKLAEAKRLGRERARPRRAAKRSVAPAVRGKAGQ